MNQGGEFAPSVLRSVLFSRGGGGSPNEKARSPKTKKMCANNLGTVSMKAPKKVLLKQGGGRESWCGVCSALFWKRQFVHKMFVHNFGAPKPPPIPKERTDGFPLKFVLKGPQTESRTLSQSYEQTLPKLRTTRIATKRATLALSWQQREADLGN